MASLLFKPSFLKSFATSRTQALLRPFPITTTTTTRLHIQQQQQQLRQLSTETRKTLETIVSKAPVVLFMKGTPEIPQCGFSRASIQILGLQGVDPEKFMAFDVLGSEEVRQGIKEYSEWPTIPQLYVNKEFIGGCDILVSMHQSGELAKLLEKEDVLAPPPPSPSPSPTTPTTTTTTTTGEEEGGKS